MTFWTKERCEIVREARARPRPLSMAQIARKVGASRGAVSGLLFRMGRAKPPPPERQKWRRTPRHYKTAEIMPSLTPFASDDTCPDFAWDDDHCRAANAMGGFPVMPRHSRASQAAA